MTARGESKKLDVLLDETDLTEAAECVLPCWGWKSAGAYDVGDSGWRYCGDVGEGEAGGGCRLSDRAGRTSNVSTRRRDGP